jgi:hypothetical protein
MKRSLVFFAAALAAVSLTGCAEKGDKAILYGDGLGKEWRPPAGGGQMRICAENYFTRDVVVQADGGGKHFELTVGPVRKRFMIVPEAEYEIKAYTEEMSAGITRLYVDKVQENGAKGLHVKIRF